jgi:hypothetical protein
MVSSTKILEEPKLFYTRGGKESKFMVSSEEIELWLLRSQPKRPYSSPKRMSI